MHAQRALYNSQSLRRLKSILPQSSLRNVYRALIESHIRYADIIWCSLSNTEMEFLQRFQNRAATMIDSSRIKDNWTPKFLSVKQLITFDCAVMVYKIFTKLCPENLWNKRKDFHTQLLKPGMKPP